MPPPPAPVASASLARTFHLSSFSQEVAVAAVLSEMAPPQARRRLGFLFQFMITVGILLAYVVDWAVIKLG